MMLISVVVPLYNQNNTIDEFYRELRPNLPEESEIIFVDNGSTDGTMHVLKSLAAEDHSVKIISLDRYCGISSALAAGFVHAKEEWILTIGADMQSDPVDIARMVKMAEGGYDIICGWRTARRDPWGIQFPDRIANFIISAFTGVWLRDYSCPLKLYRGEYAQKAPLSDELSRFLPAYIVWNRGHIGEVGVKQRPYAHTVFPGGLQHIVDVVLEILLAKFFFSAFTRPLHLFGGISFVAGMMGTASALLAVLSRVFYGSVGVVVLALAAFFFFGASLLCFIAGFLAEIASRAYAESRGQIGYHIRERINC